MAIAKRCIKTIFERKILCAGTMTDYIKIYRREIIGTTPNTTQAGERLILVSNWFGHLENRNPVQRFDGVNIAGEVTHIAYIPFDQTIFELDRNTLFLSTEQIVERWFKLLSIMNYGEQDEYIALYCKETGIKTKIASEG